MNKTLNFLKSLHSDLIDGIESGVNTEDEKAQIKEAKAKGEVFKVTRDRVTDFNFRKRRKD